jgi:UDP-2-acetamido-2,6-beta-L-arabino-hexul-4-ose reductase
MVRILVTGAHGFFGRSLISQLTENINVQVLEFCREDSLSLLNEHILIADFIYHFAGEVRPLSSDDQFESSNSQLTQSLVNILCDNNKRTPILFSSSIHAIEQKNTYGRTKRASEQIIELYSRKKLAPSWIYRLPHVFGPGCKPNYNSVITTWIHNSLHNLEINVFDRGIVMNYCYSIDLVKIFISHLTEESNSQCSYIYPQDTYLTTLGDVVDLINSFEHGAGSFKTDLTAESFAQKLYLTYQSYHNR